MWEAAKVSIRVMWYKLTSNSCGRDPVNSGTESSVVNSSTILVRKLRANWINDVHLHRADCRLGTVGFKLLWNHWCLLNPSVCPKLAPLKLVLKLMQTFAWGNNSESSSGKAGGVCKLFKGDFLWELRWYWKLFCKQKLRTIWFPLVQFVKLLEQKFL